MAPNQTVEPCNRCHDHLYAFRAQNVVENRNGRWDTIKWEKAFFAYLSTTLFTYNVVYHNEVTAYFKTIPMLF